MKKYCPSFLNKTRVLLSHSLCVSSIHSLCVSLLFTLGTPLLFASCQESLEEKAERDAKDYTRKYCPTPVINSIRTDSVTFDKTKRVYTYYMSFFEVMDDRELIDANKSKIEEMLLSGVRESTSMKAYLESGFKFRYVCRSGSDSKVTLLDVKM